MSLGSIRATDLLKLAAAIFVLVAVVAGVVWFVRVRDDDPQGESYRYFLRDVATAQAQGVPVYWLGREFTVDGRVFRGPYGARFGAEVQGGGIHMGYLLEGGNSEFALTIYSRDAWELVKDRMMSPRLPGVTRRTVSVRDKEGELLYLPSYPNRPLNVLSLALDLGEVVVLATVHAGGAVYPGGPDYNPFINNPDLLIQVMENLRPYPE